MIGIIAGDVIGSVFEGRDNKSTRFNLFSSSLYPSVEIFTIRNVNPANYKLVLIAIPREKDQ
ncbi:MAG: hypothetical protein Q8O43_02300 [Dehalococcoidia bacterium]|nr:hypothetical protein [Dehalococcoidia bacterium]